MAYKEMYECNECNFENKHVIIWKYHMKCHKRNQRIKCPLCSFSAESKFYVARHLKLHHLNMADAVPSPEYLQYAQEMEYVIQTLLDINEKLSENIDENNNHPSHSELEKEEMGQSEEPSENIDENNNNPSHSVLRKELEREEIGQSNGSTRSESNIYKCKVCNYSTDHPANLEVHEKAHNNSNNQGNGTYFSHNYLSLSVNKEFENEETGQSDENARISGSIYKCKVCNYSTDHQANVELHEKAHNNDNNQGNGTYFKCTLCNYSSHLRFVVIRHMNRDHQYPTPSSCTQENPSAESRLKSYLQAKGMDIDKEKSESANLNNDENDESKVNAVEMSLFKKEKSVILEGLKVKMIETEFRKRISQRKEEIRLARISMAETRDKIKQLKEIRSEKRRQKEMLQ